jgi:multimeric flavodoxin WrbA
MKVLGFNGSPRKNANTAQMLKNALEGAKAAGAEDVKLYHLYDYDFKGCHSCFACKLLGGKSYGHCAIKDEVTALLEEAREADVILLGSPIYFGNLSGQMRSFLERLLFPAFCYDDAYSSLWPKKIQSGMIYTMNRPSNEQYVDAMDYSVEFFLEKVFGNVSSIYSMDTYQFSDYSKYYCPSFNEAQKREVHETFFPQDCARAYELGKSLVEKVLNGIV